MVIHVSTVVTIICFPLSFLCKFTSFSNSPFYAGHIPVHFGERLYGTNEDKLMKHTVNNVIVYIFFSHSWVNYEKLGFSTHQTPRRQFKQWRQTGAVIWMAERQSTRSEAVRRFVPRVGLRRCSIFLGTRSSLHGPRCR